MVGKWVQQQGVLGTFTNTRQILTTGDETLKKKFCTKTPTYLMRTPNLSQIGEKKGGGGPVSGLFKRNSSLYRV